MNIFYRPLLYLFLTLATASHAAPSVNMSESSYAIKGTTASQLRMQMNIYGPTFSNTHFDAHTDWNIKWDFNYLDTTNDCQINKVSVNVNINYIFPKWEDKNTGDAQLQNQWDSYLLHLRTHEQNHAEHGKIAAREIESILKNLPAMENCQILTDTAKNDVEKIMAEYQSKDVQYDIDTQHGKKEGAVFP